MNYWERHIGDYARDAGHLSMIEHGAYSMLLDRYYSTEQPIPEDQAHRVCRARTKEERAAVDVVLVEFFQLVDKHWVNGRAAREIVKAQAKIEAARTNGAKGGRPRANPKATEQKPTGLSLGSVSETQSKAHQSPDTSLHTAPSPPSVKKGRVPRAASTAIARPDGVDEQTWADWQQLRKLKKAGVSQTVVDAAAAEAAKAGVTLDAFFKAWCLRGSQGMEASWLKPHERGGKPASRHAGFSEIDYRQGVSDDGTIIQQ